MGNYLGGNVSLQKLGGLTPPLPLPPAINLLVFEYLLFFLGPNIHHLVLFNVDLQVFD
jgi:hypothetical protein